MPNPLRGEVALPPAVALGNRSPVLCFDFDALCAIEQALAIKITGLGAEQMMSLLGLRCVTATGLKRHHGALGPDIVGAVIGACGRIAVIGAVNEALRLAFPEPSGRPASADDDDGWDWWRCFEIWIEMGFDPDAFWRQTPRTFHHTVAGHSTRAGNEFDRIGWLAWTTAALSRAKKLPRLQSILRRREPQPKKASKAKPWEGQLAAWASVVKREKRGRK